MGTYLALCAIKELENLLESLVEMSEESGNEMSSTKAGYVIRRALLVSEKIRFEIEALGE